MFAADTRAVVVPVTGASQKETHATWKHIAEPVEPFLEAVAQRLEKQVREFDPAIVPYAEYALTGQGKQLRPALVALSANASGTLNDSHVTIAVIIEMVHLATLVHDDVMDEAEIRRGRLTLAANWGNEIAVLFGDCLFAHALKLAASFPTPEICRAVAMATNTVCSGEILQTQQRRNFQFSQPEYFKVLEMKTAELFALSCDLGACLTGAPAVQRNGLRQFGMALGTAYQLYDDCLDLFGSEAAAGKSLGTDLAKGKLTLPILLAWEQATVEEKATLQGNILKWEPGHFAPVIELLRKYKTFAKSVEIINQYLEKSRQTLKVLPESANQAGLIGLTEFLARQTEKLGVCA
ncbi:polyprenyl synthetase family protein [Pedosphaera parvula]|uniref:Polyprenyl synthetase n=1 Tax=Pedosphaera parvula (strain Ellin514) TaxID=320771 RepID=B9XS46_PEDPL|nr:polyprenyl synthetase family protein [Pedosphaera parvula]EEF57342.1 Polyprenyl synthetase [Pedosphaera parvula Ellin514]